MAAFTIGQPTATIDERHCGHCGNTEPLDLDTWDDDELQGYSACCNEPVIDEGECDHHCHH